MPTLNRRTATRVRDGRVQKKNNWRPDRRDLFAIPQSEIQLERRTPGDGARHLITIRQLRAFLALLPDWEEVAIGLDAIVLDTYEALDGSMGWYGDGVVAVCAWEHDVWWDIVEQHFLDAHRPVLDLLDVERRQLAREEVDELLGPIAHRFNDRMFELRWTEGQARAFQLLHILPHELGHHHDRITTRSKRRIARGERYAETYANRVMHEVWPAYIRAFNL